MTSLINLQRRNLLKYAAIGIARAVTYPVWSQAIEFKQVNKPSADFHPDVEIELTNSSGWKDVVLVMPGEKVTILKPFNDFKGMFMYHCHNLEYEDMGMMRDLLVK